MQLVISALDYEKLAQALFEPAPAEAAAFLAAEPNGQVLRVRSYRVFDRDQLDGDGYGHIAIQEEVQVRALAAIKRAGHAAVEVHTHPGSGSQVGFSSYDDRELPLFARYVQNKLPGKPFAALVLGEAGFAGRSWSAERVEGPLTLEFVGESSAIPPWASSRGGGEKDTARFDRQFRALGRRGQAQLQRLRVGVVGLGGTGSQVVQQLAHLGVCDFVLVDDDRVEASNLPRLAGATWWDVPLRRSKVFVARRTIRRVARGRSVAPAGTLRRRTALAALREVDLIIGCVDNDGARLVLSELAAAFLIPYLDLGVGIEGEPGGAQAIGGRVAFCLPGGPCLACADELDFAEAAEDLETEAARQMRVERGYARDRTVEPALMPLNTTVVGLAMIEFIAFATGVRPVVPFLRYDAVAARVIRLNVSVSEDCPVCGPAKAMGSRQQIERYALE